jgi:hypothetical protein
MLNWSRLPLTAYSVHQMQWNRNKIADSSEAKQYSWILTTAIIEADYLHGYIIKR